MARGARISRRAFPGVLIAAALVVVTVPLATMFIKSPPRNAAVPRWRRAHEPSPPPPPSGVERIALVAVHAGAELPWYANYFAESCGAQRRGIVDCIILLVSGESAAAPSAPAIPAAAFACRRDDDDLPSNVLVLSVGYPGFRALVYARTGVNFSVELPDPRKLADAKPLLGEVLADPWLLPYAVWGWVDLDSVLGDVASFADAAAALARDAQAGAVTASNSQGDNRGVARWGWPTYGDPDSAKPWDIWSSTYEGQAGGWPAVAGQFALLRNSPAHTGLWRHAPTIPSEATAGESRLQVCGVCRRLVPTACAADVSFAAAMPSAGMLPRWQSGAYSRADMESPWHMNFDEVGVGSAVRVLVNVSAPPAFEANDASAGDDAPATRHLRALRTVDGFSDHLSVCIEGSGGGVGIGAGTPVQYRYLWECGRLWRQHACGAVAGGRVPSAPPKEGLYYHFMCSKWSAAFWGGGEGGGSEIFHEAGDDVSGGSGGDILSAEAVQGYAEGLMVPERLRNQCSVRGGGRWHARRWNITFTADATAVLYSPGGAAALSGGAASGKRGFPQHLPMNSKNVPDAALFTFHDALWGTRPLRGCDSDTPAAPQYGLPARRHDDHATGTGVAGG